MWAKGVAIAYLAFFAAGCLGPAMPTGNSNSFPSATRPTNYPMNSVESYAIHPRDGSIIASYHNGSGHASLYRIDGLGETTLFLDWDNVDLRLPSFNEDGSRLGFVATSFVGNSVHHEISSYEMSDGQVQVLGRTNLWVQQAAISPTGSMIAFVQSPETGEPLPWIQAMNEADVWTAQDGRLTRLTTWEANWVTDVAFLDNDTILAAAEIIPSRQPPKIEGVYRVSTTGSVSQVPSDSFRGRTPHSLCIHPSGEWLAANHAEIMTHRIGTEEWRSHGAFSYRHDEPCLEASFNSIIIIAYENYADDPKHLERFDLRTHQATRIGPG